MADYIAVFKPLIDKLGALIEIFDLSFFVSGGLCVALVAYGNVELNLGLPYNWLEPQLGTVVALTLWAYTCGLVCVVAGRSTRKWANKKRWNLEDELTGEAGKALTVWARRRRRFLAWVLRRAGAARKRPEQLAMFERAFQNKALGQGCPVDSIGPLMKMDPEVADGRVHALLWGMHQQEFRLRPSFESLRSFWVRAAVYDGLSTALVLWGTGLYFIWVGNYLPIDAAGRTIPGWERLTAPFAALLTPPVTDTSALWMYDHPLLAWWLIFMMVWSAALCWREANRTEKALREDLLVSAVWFFSRPPPTPGTPVEIPKDPFNTDVA